VRSSDLIGKGMDRKVSMPRKGGLTIERTAPSGMTLVPLPPLVHQATSTLSVFPILLVPSPSSEVVEGGAQRQKSVAELIKAFWHIELGSEPVPHWLVPLWPCSDLSGAFSGV
jgi:hypothetical protein